MSLLKQQPTLIKPEQMRGIRRGIEKESLRVLPNARLALTPHPMSLGSALTHPHITTDFCESQLELVTGVHTSVEAVLAQLTEIHQVVYHELAALGKEMLWASSMPCGLPIDETIPVGRYGSSNVARAKSVYRTGLGHRYGRRMQTISGIHYNWSMPGIDSAGYFGLIRNFRRNEVVLLYLFGASPAVCASFVEGRDHCLQPMGAHTMYLPHATSLRMGRLGYQSDAQASLAVSHNSLESYAASLDEALTKPYPAYEAIGIQNPGGDYNQLSTTLLQIENEFYGTIRPKRTIKPGERPLHALRERGVEYVEVRLMDLDPFECIGVRADTARFLDMFLLYCLVTESAFDTPKEIEYLKRNQHLVAERGREPGLTLQRLDAPVTLADWTADIVSAMTPIAQQLDDAVGGNAYADALQQVRSTLEQPYMLPSARVLQSVQRDHEESFTAFAHERSVVGREALLALPFAPELQARFESLASESLATQKRIEQADSVPFETYRQEYVSSERLGRSSSV